MKARHPECVKDTIVLIERAASFMWDLVHIEIFSHLSFASLFCTYIWSPEVMGNFMFDCRKPCAYKIYSNYIQNQA